MSENAIVTAEVRELAPALPVAEVTRRYKQMAEFASGVMRSDVDYGVIPGTGKKPTLLKPGAEKLTVLFGLEARFNLVDRTEDWGNGFFFYRYECRLVHRDTGLVMGNAYGSCNSRESKYRWRNVPAWKATEEEKKAAIRQEHKTGRNGDYVVYVVANAEPYDLVNTMDKMAQKRALVAAVLVGTGASEFFTQDMEDFAPEPVEPPTAKAPNAPAPTEPAPPEPTPEPEPPARNAWTTDDKALGRFWKICREDKGLNDAEVHVALGVEHLSEFKGTGKEAMAAIDAYIAKAQEAGNA